MLNVENKIVTHIRNTLHEKVKIVYDFNFNIAVYYYVTNPQYDMINILQAKSIIEQIRN